MVPDLPSVSELPNEELLARIADPSGVDAEAASEALRRMQAAEPRTRGRPWDPDNGGC